MTRGTRQRAFTLLEVLAVVLLTSIVIGVALNHYVNLSRASQRAMQTARGIRHATAILDRVARDLENVVLVAKEPETDPLEHPWLFYGESRRSEAGADHLKFVTRGHRPRRTAAHESDLEVVAYSLRQGEQGDFELMRWSSPRLPESLDRELPGDESEGALLLADGLADFGVQFIDELGERSSSWDSSQLSDSGELPLAVEIEVALADPDGDPEVEPPRYRRRVILPLRPLDLQELFDPQSLVSGGPGEEEQEGEEGEDDEEGGGEGSFARCEQSPCANMTACQAINCRAKLGLYKHSVNVLLEVTLEQNPSFCWWWIRHRSVRWLIDNPGCR